MKKYKSFSRFLLWILIVLEGLSLAVVIGFLYAMLNRAITREYRHDIDRRAVEIQHMMTRRGDLAQNRIDEISSNNSIGVSLLLGMHDKADELMQRLYPPTDGASFYLRHTSGMIVPEPRLGIAFLNHLDVDYTKQFASLRLDINPTMTVFVKSMRRNQKLLGHVIGVYDITKDPAVANAVDIDQNVRLIARMQTHDVVIGPGSLNPIPRRLGDRRAEPGRAKIGRQFGDAMIPLQDYSNLYLAVSDTQLNKKRWNLIVYLIWLCLPLFGLTLTVSFLILRKVTSSINALAQNAMAIADASSPEDLDEQRVQHEEFLHLAQAFNKVLSKVRRRTRELRRHQRHLDQLVEERTAELHASNRKLKQTQAQMVHSEKMASIGQLAAGVAHEINNPIGFIKSNLYTLKGYCGDIKGLLTHYQELASILEDARPDNVTVPELLSKIEQYKAAIDFDYVNDELACILDESKDGVERVARIVSILKDFSHADSGLVTYADINEGIESTLNIVWNQLKYKAKVHKDYGELPPVKCDMEKLNQVFMNLLINAGQAIEQDGIIDIRTRCNQNLVEINIRDNGCGIPPGIMPKIFDPFFTTKAVGSGTGLGLNLVYNVIKNHNGSIHVESDVGKGASFTIRLDVDGSAVGTYPS